jgi:hypothetical protein
MAGIHVDPLLRFILIFYGVMLVVGPLTVRSQFRYQAKIDPQPLPIEALPAEIRAFMEPRLAGIQNLGFELVSYLRVGALTGGTQAYMALFSNPRTCEWADISAVRSRTALRGYIEFITRCSEDVQVDTNTNSTAGVLASHPAKRLVFRFPQVTDAFVLYRLHKMLVQEKTGGARPVLPPEGQEIGELKRRLERFGPTQAELGYMYLDEASQTYRLTWKGAIFAAWRSLWPVPALRSWQMKQAGASRLRALGVASQPL